MPYIARVLEAYEDEVAGAGGDWMKLMQQSVNSYARYVGGFKALEAMAPGEDRRVIEALTAHEVQLIEWMRAETGS